MSFTAESLEQTFHHPFTFSAVQALNGAETEARNLGHSYIGTEHLLLGVISQGETALQGLGVNPEKVRACIELILERGHSPSQQTIEFTPRAREVIEIAVIEARLLRMQAHLEEGLSRYHIELGLLAEEEGIAAGVMESFGIRKERLKTIVIKRIMAERYPVLDKLDLIREFMLDTDQNAEMKRQVEKNLDRALDLIQNSADQGRTFKT